jgi:hypothetical protein
MYYIYIQLSARCNASSADCSMFSLNYGDRIGRGVYGCSINTVGILELVKGQGGGVLR